jgi:hypothetical protein
LEQAIWKFLQSKWPSVARKRMLPVINAVVILPRRIVVFLTSYARIKHQKPKTVLARVAGSYGEHRHYNNDEYLTTYIKKKKMMKLVVPRTISIKTCEADKLMNSVTRESGLC